MVLQVILETVSQEKLQNIRIKLSRSYLLWEAKALIKFNFPAMYITIRGGEGQGGDGGGGGGWLFYVLYTMCSDAHDFIKDTS